MNPSQYKVAFNLLSTYFFHYSHFLGPANPPKNVKVKVLSANSVSVTWSSLADDEADSYIIREINGFVNEMTVEGEENTTILSGLTRGMNYTFVVHAFIDIPSAASSPASILFDGMTCTHKYYSSNPLFNALFSSLTSHVTLC